MSADKVSCMKEASMKAGRGAISAGQSSVREQVGF
jgi:hypothetical protein